MKWRGIIGAANQMIVSVMAPLKSEGWVKKLKVILKKGYAMKVGKNAK